MEIYLVGGAVRDQLLGRKVQERDWVVVGATADDMIKQGYRPVGKDFPVFLHPETKEEYALARTERKTAKGYKGFTVHAEPDVSLDEDLRRRDLTINAMAMDEAGNIIDPYSGQQDLAAKIFRHVSPAFTEDPVRILRIARFAARMPEFSIAEDTMALMHDMVTAGEVDALVPERVWQELVRSLGEDNPSRFFRILQQCDALAIIMPELVTDYDMIINQLSAFAKQSKEALFRFAAFCQSLSEANIESLSARLHIPSYFTELALAVKQLLEFYQHKQKPTAELLLDQLMRMDCLRKHTRFSQSIQIANLLNKRPRLTKLLIEGQRTLKSINTEPLQQLNLKGFEFAEALKKMRLVALRELLA